MPGESKKGVYTTDFSADSKLLAIGGAGFMTVYEPTFASTD